MLWNPGKVAPVAPDCSGMEQPTAVPLARAAALAGVSVQALRMRIRRGTLMGVPVEQGGATVQGVEVEELRQAYGELREPDALEGDMGPSVAQEQRAERGDESPRERPRTGDEREKEQPEQPAAALAAAEKTHAALVQGWRDAREALVAVRETHAAEVERLEQFLEHERAGRRDAVRWGRVAVGVVVAVGAVASWGLLRAEQRASAAVRDAAAPVERMAEEIAQARERAARAEEQATTAEQRALEAEQREEQLRRAAGLTRGAMKVVSSVARDGGAWLAGVR